MCSVKPVIVAQPETFRRRFNLGKSDWNGYSTEFDNFIQDVDSTLEKLCKVHKVIASEIQEIYNERMQITVHPWSIRGITESD